MKKLAVVYYASTLGKWEEVTRNALDRMIAAGLYDAADELYVIVSDIQTTNEEIIQKLQNDYSKCTVERFVTNTGSEYNGIKKVEYIGNIPEQEYNILYLHSKGIMNIYKTVQTAMEPYALKVNGVKSWIDSMHYYLIDQWRANVSKLNDGFDTLGVRNVHHWWWGNFWWASSTHIKKLNSYLGGTRWDCEAWLHNYHPNKDEIKFYEWFKYEYNPYYSNVPMKLWDLSPKDSITLRVNKIEIGCFGEQQDEGRPTPSEPTVLDVTEIGMKYFDGRKLNVWSLFNECGTVCSDSQSVRMYVSLNDCVEEEFIVTSHGGLFQHILFVNEL
jgi:hypothetical protein